MFLYNFLIFLLLSFLFLYPIPYTLYPAFAIADPLKSPNNRFGIHIISASPDESSPAAGMVNSGGDWGYVTVLVESKDRNKEKWQEFFNDLRRRHMIPLIRLATQADSPPAGGWKRPYEGEEQAWAGFLNSLVWPTKNRYVVVYNEPNHAAEWGGAADPAHYAQVLKKTIDALKKESPDFFVLNAGFDSSAPHKPPKYYDEARFLLEMEKEVPGVFDSLDGWVSHSYPNPGFVGLPNGSGRNSVRGFEWELEYLRQIGVRKTIPVFITETGWKHSGGLKQDKTLPSPEKVAQYFQEAFRSAWNSPNIVAVTPFLLNYQQEPFDHFSFKRITGEGQIKKLPGEKEVLAASYPDFYPQYQAIKDIPKIKGEPIQESRAELIKGEVLGTMVEGEEYLMDLTFKNKGQSIWDNSTELVFSANELNISVSGGSLDKVEPGQDYSFKLLVKAKASGTYKTTLNLYNGQKPFDSEPFEFTTYVKEPALLNIDVTLKWKQGSIGKYRLNIEGPHTPGVKYLDTPGVCCLEVRDLLPEYTYDFTIEKPFYKPKTIRVRVASGENVLDFGILEPDFLKAIFHPLEFWKLLPWSG